MALSANFLTELANPNFQGNVVLEIDGTFFSQYQPDSGLVVDADKLAIVDTVKLNGVALDIRKANTPIATIGFTLVDTNEVISAFRGASDSQLQGTEVKAYFGFITGSFDFADYALLSVARVTSITKVPNGYSFSSKDVTDLMQRELLNISSVLDAAISDVDNTLTLTNASSFPASGRIKINDEFLQYTSITDDTLNGVSRGDLGSTAAEHDQGDSVFLVTKKDAESMDILLDIILNDLAIAPALVDQTSFTDLRDDEFSGEANFVLYIYDVDNALSWIETRLLESTNTRLFSLNGVITIGLLDQVPKTGVIPEINELHTIDTPSWNINSDKIVNRIVVKWFFNEGTQKFAKTTEFTDTDSIATYEERKPLEMKLYGVQDS